MQDRREGGRIFNIGFWEVILVLLIAFLVVGPKDLPRVARWLGRMVKKLRLLIREVKKETGWDELEKEMKDTSSSLNKEIKGLEKDLDISSDLKSVSAEFKSNMNDIQQELKTTEKAVKDSKEKEPDKK